MWNAVKVVAKDIESKFTLSLSDLHNAFCAKTTPVGFEPTRGDHIGLAGRRLSRSAKVSLTRHKDTQISAGDPYSPAHAHNSLQDSNVSICHIFQVAACLGRLLCLFLSWSHVFRSMSLQYMFSSQVFADWGKRHLWDSSPRGETPSAQQADALATRPNCL